jgi:hypothetical protein
MLQVVAVVVQARVNIGAVRAVHKCVVVLIQLPAALAEQVAV